VKRVLPIVACVLAVLGALAIRVVVEGRSALAAGDYETAARWYLPFAPHVDEAYANLRTLTKSEDPAVALAAWRSIRSAARATRSLWQPHADDLAEADAQIAKLSAAAPGGGKLDGGDRLAWHQDRLARDVRPSLAAAILAGVGIALWVAGAFVLARRGTFAVGPTGVIVLGLALWLVGLYKT
jgi:hypothetical protein